MYGSRIIDYQAFSLLAPVLQALSDRVALLVGGLVQEWQEWFGSKAEYLGQQVGVEQHVLNVFVDEVLRSSVLFGVSGSGAD